MTDEPIDETNRVYLNTPYAPGQQRTLRDELLYQFSGLQSYVGEALPESRGRELALTKLDEAVMWTMYALAQDQEFD